MSRGGSDDYDEDFPNQGAFWLAKTWRVGERYLDHLTEELPRLIPHRAPALPKAEVLGAGLTREQWLVAREGIGASEIPAVLAEKAQELPDEHEVARRANRAARNRGSVENLSTSPRMIVPNCGPRCTCRGTLSTASAPDPFRVAADEPAAEPPSAAGRFSTDEKETNHDHPR